jgi:hypothetical protein
VPKIDLTDEERRALADVAREYVRTQRYPLAPRLASIKAALAKLAPNHEMPPPPGRRRPKKAVRLSYNSRRSLRKQRKPLRVVARACCSLQEALDGARQQQDIET